MKIDYDILLSQNQVDLLVFAWHSRFCFTCSARGLENRVKKPQCEIRKAGLGKRINMIMQTVFFKLSGRLRYMPHRCGMAWRSASCSPVA